MKKITKFIRHSSSISGIILLIGAIILNIIVQGNSFFSRANIGSVFRMNTPLILAAIAQVVIVIAGGIDLSIGATIALVNGVAITLAYKFGWPIFPSWMMALSASVLVGALNGFIVGYLRITPLLATFGSSSLITGLLLIVLPRPAGTVPREVYSIYGNFYLGLPMPVWIILFVLLIWYIINRFPIGKHFKAVGGNEGSAFASGINPAKVKLQAYMLGGFITGLAGLSVTALTASGDPRIGNPFTLNSIAAIILGGTILSGGWGSTIGAVSGALFLAIVQNIVFYVFNFLVATIPNFTPSTYYQQLLSNLIVLFGLASAVITSKGTNFLTKEKGTVRETSNE